MLIHQTIILGCIVLGLGIGAMLGRRSLLSVTLGLSNALVGSLLIMRALDFVGPSVTAQVDQAPQTLKQDGLTYGLVIGMVLLSVIIFGSILALKKSEISKTTKI